MLLAKKYKKKQPVTIESSLQVCMVSKERERKGKRANGGNVEKHELALGSVEFPLRKYCISFAKSTTSKLLNYLFKCNAVVAQRQ